jgi:hypothetical protein
MPKKITQKKKQKKKIKKKKPQKKKKKKTQKKKKKYAKMPKKIWQRNIPKYMPQKYERNIFVPVKLTGADTRRGDDRRDDARGVKSLGK